MAKKTARILFLCPVLCIVFWYPVAPPAKGFETVDEVRCACADDALGTGDYVSCVAHLSRRLVAKGALTPPERGDLVSGASSTDLVALQADCDASGGGGGGGGSGTVALAGWGISLQIDRPFHPAPSPSGPTSGVIATLRLWNRSRDEILLTYPVLPSGEGCEFLVRVRDSQDHIVRESIVGCVEVLTAELVPTGTVLTRADFMVPLVTENADPATGLPDGEKLPVGVYRLEVTWNAHGPGKPSHGPAMDGGFPTAVITLRVG